MTTKSNFIYKLILNKNNGFPFEVLQVNDLTTDFIKTSFTEVETNPDPPSESSWYYSTYTPGYKIITGQAIPQLLSSGSPAPGWELKVYNKNGALSLKDLAGKVVLVDFWIKNCSPCIQSVSHLNALQDKFRSRGLSIISINSYDPVEDVSWFYNKYNINYPVLLNGKEIAEKYGVSGFPAFFIIDKKGKIIYSGAGYDNLMQSEMESVIEKALK
jgi:peroxiredoxin